VGHGRNSTARFRAIDPTLLSRTGRGCHTPPLIDRVYSEAEKVVDNTNQQVQQAADLMAALKKEGVLATPPFSQPIDFVYFDILIAQAFVGLIGFGFHVATVFRQPGRAFFERILSGAPPMAPLLFPNLVILAWIALWSWSRSWRASRH
jgi:hypothetical protein